ncbi:MAG: SDR family oxidoreductase [Acidimicrobiales bacterium]
MASAAGGIDVTYGIENKVAIVTGPGGFGAGYCRGLADAGASVVVADTAESGGATLEELRSAGREAFLIETDVTSEASARDMANEVGERFGGADILVNNAAMFQGLPFPPPDPIEEMPLELWNRVLTVNLTSVFIVSRAVIPLMRERGGVIINQSSPAVWQNSPGRMHYTVAKGALLPMTRSMARELAPAHIRVNAIAPGPVVAGDMGGIDAKMADRMTERMAIKRLGTPEDLVGPLLFLASKMSAWMTGQVLVVDGGGFMVG